MANRPARAFLRNRIVDENGIPTGDFARFLSQELLPKTDTSLNQEGQITPATAIAGRTEGIGTTVQHVDLTGKLQPQGVGFVVDDVADGPTYSKIKGVELGAGFINQVNSISTDTAASTVLSQDGTTSIIDIAGFVQKYARGSVAYNSGTVDAGSNTAKGYVFTVDPLYQGGPVVYQFTTTYDDQWNAPGTLQLGGITLSGGGGGSGGGNGGGNFNPCFSPNVKLRGGIGIGELKDHQFVHTRHRVLGAKVRVRHYAGPMLDMGGGELVTLGHHFVCGDVELEARQIWTARVEYAGPVYNLEIETDQDDQRNYFLDNGMLSHNMRYNGC